MAGSVTSRSRALIAGTQELNMCNVLCLQGALALLNVETGLDTVSEFEAIGAFVVLLLLTEDLWGNSAK